LGKLAKVLVKHLVHVRAEQREEFLHVFDCLGLARLGVVERIVRDDVDDIDR
jgi:hypothetical protein